MRHAPGARAATFGACLAAGALAAALFGAAPPAAIAAAPADSTRTALADSIPAAPADSPAGVPPDTSGVVPAPRPRAPAAVATASPVEPVATAASAPAPPPSLLALEIATPRRDGATSATRQWRGAWPARVVAWPFASDAFDVPVSLDGGRPIAPWKSSSSDRTAVAGFAIPFGVPNGAAVFAAPPPPEGDPFLADAWARPAGFRPPIEGAAELLGAPPAALWWRRPLLEGGPALPPTSSALYYEKGGDGVEETGVRFAAPAFARGVAAAYTRRASDGEGAFLRALDTRYVLAAMLPTIAGARLWVDGSIASRSLEGAAPDPVSERREAGRAEGDARSIALHARSASDVSAMEWEIRAARVRHTQIDPEEIGAARERWDQPSRSLRAEYSRRLDDDWRLLATGRAEDVRLRLKAGPAATSGGTLDEALDAGRWEGRLALGLRRGAPDSARAGTRWGADLAWDGRERDRPFLDARISIASEGRRAAGEADLESAHERATWEDRLLPPRERVLARGLPPTTYRYLVVADPSLRPRRLSGLVARGAWKAAGDLRLHASASARYIADDFGWTLSRSETADTVLVVDRAEARGSAWATHTSVGFAWTRGFLSLRGSGWAVGGGGGAAPRAGAPPRSGLDAALDANAVLFQGDLPLRIGFEVHAVSARRGVIRAPGFATAAASLRADFTDAGLFFRLEDLFDRRPPSGAYEITTDDGIPLPGRLLRVGVVWHLLD